MKKAINRIVAGAASIMLAPVTFGLILPASAQAEKVGAPPVESIGLVKMKFTAPKPESNDILAQLGLVPAGEEDEPPSTEGWCTGWVVDVQNDSAYIMTAGHCMDKAGAANTLDVEDPESLRLDVTFTRADNVGGIATPNPRQAQVVEVRPRDNGDLALLRIKRFAGERLTPLPIATTPSKVGDEIASTGFPKQPDDINKAPDLLTTFGNVTSQSSPSDENAAFFMTVQTPMGGGMSGGPVIGENGVVGLVSRGVPKSDLFQYVTDQEGLRQFLLSNGIDPVAVAKQKLEVAVLNPPANAPAVRNEGPAVDVAFSSAIAGWPAWFTVLLGLAGSSVVFLGALLIRSGNPRKPKRAPAHRSYYRY